jgi:5-methylcytosine-specific restriction endonuclease McrA
MSGSWAGSTRKARLPANWESEIRPAVLARDGRACQWRLGHGVCGAAANQVDHVNPRGGDGMDNLRALCEPHHQFKSSREGGVAAGVMRSRIAAARYRKPEQHPGLVR